MINLITGIIAIVGVIVFLGNYAYKIESWPLTFFIVVVLALPIYDFYRSVKRQQHQTGNDAVRDDDETVKAREPGTIREMDKTDMGETDS